MPRRRRLARTGALGDGESGSNTPPHRHSLELARLLLEAGADPNDSQTLYNRHWRPDDARLELLLDYGLGRGTTTVWSSRRGLTHPTPQDLVEEELRGAAEAGRLGRVGLLLDRVDNVDGIGCDHPLLEGCTAHQLAVPNGNTQIAALLAQAGAVAQPLTPVEEVRAACMRADRATVDPLLARDPALARQLTGTWPDLVCAAVGLRRIDALRLLVEVGCDLNPTGCRTPLHEAAFHGHLDVAVPSSPWVPTPPSATPTTTAHPSGGPPTTSSTPSPATSPASTDAADAPGARMLGTATAGTTRVPGESSDLAWVGPAHPMSVVSGR